MPRASRSTQHRVRANLALVIGLQGRYAEAEKIVRADLPPAEAAANVTQLKTAAVAQGEENARAEVEKMPIASAGCSHELFLQRACDPAGDRIASGKHASVWI